MKVLAGGFLSIMLGIAMLPAVLVGGDELPPLPCGAGTAEVQTILATIRTLESGGNYQAQARGSTASGAYQFIDGTWNGYGGYSRAADAPPEVQDAKAAEMVLDVLERFGDVSAVPVIWYIGHMPAAGSPEWDTVSYPSAGNVLTPRRYQERWLRELTMQQPSAGEPTKPMPPNCSDVLRPTRGDVQPDAYMLTSAMAYPQPLPLMVLCVLRAAVPRFAPALTRPGVTVIGLLMRP